MRAEQLKKNNRMTTESLDFNPAHIEKTDTLTSQGDFMNHHDLKDLKESINSDT